MNPGNKTFETDFNFAMILQFSKYKLRKNTKIFAFCLITTWVIIACFLTNKTHFIVFVIVCPKN